MNKILQVIFILSLISCSSDEQSSYKPLQNTLPDDGPLINYDPNASLTNIPEIDKFLDEKNAEIFNKSLSWYGTESEFGLDRIHNKNAKQLVDIVNCLKVSEPGQQNKCFE